MTMNRNIDVVNELIQKGVDILAPQSVYIAPEVNIDRIAPKTIIYPGTTITGETTSIGAHCKIGMGGGAHLENVQIGNGVSLMQGVYRDSTLLDGVSIRNGAELRDNCLLEEGVDIGHTVGLKQTILFPNVVLGSLINFCDALMAGGTSRRDHSEVGSCMALYNFTPQGDKFASLFGNVVDGLFLDCQPIFIGGQSQIVSPVSVGFGSVIAAGSKLSHDIAPNKLAISHKSCDEMRDFDARLIFNPAKKIANTLAYIAQLRVLSLWYENIRIPLADDVERQYLYTAAQKRILNAIKERQKRLARFVDKLQQSLELHTAHGNDAQIADHQKARHLSQNGTTSDFERIASQIDFSAIRNALAKALASGSTYTQAVQQLTKTITSSMKRTLQRLV